ncbi:MAG TPA: BatA domain-containing protein [Vicinamibacterales bacterium]|nr:BatA domain-containing protein [Vicinamibacterales bacterium]HVH54764.1 BatA domain-containing protein [Vicinamibacterales bacterium]
MNFLAPLFFVALAGLAIPVLLHLTQREKKQIIRFPSLMFVRRIPYQSVRRRKIQHWLLLLVRVAALALIVFAFARPFFRQADLPVAIGAGARELVVLLDNSYSMGFADRWERARSAAQAEISRMSGSDRGSVVLFSSGADIAVRASMERSPLSAAVAASKPGSGATRYAPALKVAGGILAESTLPRREVVIISDFQRNGWRGEEGIRLPQGTVVKPVTITGSGDQVNVSVTAVSLARSTFSDQERITVTAGLTNRSEKEVNGTTVTLDVNGIKHGTKTVKLEPGATAPVEFEPVLVGAKTVKATVTLSPDALAADNTFNFVVAPTAPVHVTVVDRVSDSSGVYLARALAVGQAPRFEVINKQPDTLTDADLQRSAAVVLNDISVPPALARRLARYVEQGGGLFVAAGQRATWPQEVDLLPGSIENPVDRTRGDAARVGALEYAHPVFEPFRAPRSGNFSTVPIYQYRKVSPAKDAQVLAKFDGTVPAVIERRVGTGRVLLWASALDTSWSELPTRGVFVPFVHQSMRYLAAYSEPKPWLSVGQVLDASTAALKHDTAQRVVLTPSGKRLLLQDEGSEVMELTEQGFYELRARDKETVVVAANVDVAEGDLYPIDPKEIVAAATGGADAAAGETAPNIPLTPEAQERRQRLWWYLLVAGLLLLGADTLMSNRLAKT